MIVVPLFFKNIRGRSRVWSCHPTRLNQSYIAEKFFRLFASYSIHKPHLVYGRGMKSGIRVGYMLHLGSYPKQPVGYLLTSLQPLSRQPNRFVFVHRIADEPCSCNRLMVSKSNHFQALPLSILKVANRASTASSISLSSYSMIVSPLVFFKLTVNLTNHQDG